MSRTWWIVLTMSATCGNSVVFCTFWNIGTCCCVTMSTSITRSVWWLWWTSTVFRSCWVLLHNWDINDHDVVDQKDWCLQNLWHIDNFVNGLGLTLHWDSDNLVNELHLMDFNSFLQLLMTRTWLRTTTDIETRTITP